MAMNWLRGLGGAGAAMTPGGGAPRMPMGPPPSGMPPPMGGEAPPMGPPPGPPPEAGGGGDLFSTLLQRAGGIGPSLEPSMAGVPKPGSALWHILNVGRQGMPEMQQLQKFLPLNDITKKIGSKLDVPEGMYQRLLGRFGGRGGM